MSLFDKYVSSVFAYGSAVWGLPNKCNLLYLEDFPEGEGTRTAVTRFYETAVAIMCRSQTAGELAKKSLTQLGACLLI